MADRAHSTSRRALLAGLSATPLLTVPALADAAPAPVTEWERVPIPAWDGALLARRPAILAQIAEVEALGGAMDDREERCHAAAGPRPEEGTPAFVAWRRRFRKLEKSTGYRAANAAWQAADFRLLDSLRALAEVPAVTLAGLRMKAHLVEHCEDLAESIVADLLAIDAAIVADTTRPY